MRATLAAACLLTLGCLPRDNPFDRADLEHAYGITVSAPEGALTVHFNLLSGKGLLGYRIYREDAAETRVLVAELAPDLDQWVDEGAGAAAQAALLATGQETLWWRVAAYTEGGEGPLSARSDLASTRVLPDTVIDPQLPNYISGQAGVAIMVQVLSSNLEGQPAAHHFQYHFRGGPWGEPILAGPLVLTGLPDGRFTLEAAAVDEKGNADITPAQTTFTYDFNVPEGTPCDPAVCNSDLTCVEEPVGKFCRALCIPPGSSATGGVTECPGGMTCRVASGQGELGACVAVGVASERCDDRLCADGLNCGDATDARHICGTPCGGSGDCSGGQVCINQACMTQVTAGSVCSSAACPSGYACEEAASNPICRRRCSTNLSCGGGEICVDLGRGDLKICR